MKDSRVGQSLWEEWYGLGYDEFRPNSMVFYTIDHVSLDEDVVLRALASCLQRDGIADSLLDGFNLLSKASVTHTYAGVTDTDSELSICDSDGYTEYGDLVEEIKRVTLVDF
jgi:hypothetical protein